ncbi:unnamed protein product [Ilex paraguariensis]|uniref:Uncharacterized protein n=1 Tax=Ilex paraguariensis TaxID=185542 RepID=A0ABC8SHP2_9AQUA
MSIWDMSPSEVPYRKALLLPSSNVARILHPSQWYCSLMTPITPRTKIPLGWPGHFIFMTFCLRILSYRDQ